MALGRSAAVLAAFAVGAPVLAGVVLLITAPAPASRVGWFAYAPLQDAPPAASVIVTNWQQCLGGTRGGRLAYCSCCCRLPRWACERGWPLTCAGVRAVRRLLTVRFMASQSVRSVKLAARWVV